jgi:hypothetical protein
MNFFQKLINQALDDRLRELEDERYKAKNEMCNGENGYYGPKKYQDLYNSGINPRCGRPLSYCNEGLAHVCYHPSDDYRPSEDMVKQESDEGQEIDKKKLIAESKELLDRVEKLLKQVKK